MIVRQVLQFLPYAEWYCNQHPKYPPPTSPTCTRYISQHVHTSMHRPSRISVSNTDQMQYSLVLIKIAIHSSTDKPGVKTMNLLGCSLLALIIPLPNHKTATPLWNIKKEYRSEKSMVNTINVSDSITRVSLLFVNFCGSFSWVMIIQRQC